MHQIKDPVEASHRVAQLMRGIEPQDAIEGMIGSMLAATHHASLTMLSRALHPQQDSDVAHQCTLRAERLLKRYTELVVALGKYRGRTTEQRVVVQHVSVTDGGQAIVGSVTKHG